MATELIGTNYPCLSIDVNEKPAKSSRILDVGDYRPVLPRYVPCSCYVSMAQPGELRLGRWLRRDDDEDMSSFFSDGLAQVINARVADWRIGPVVYQVIVDRFSPSDNLNAKRHLYAAPRKLRKWEDLPRKGPRVRSVGLWSHELAFWGGDLRSVRSRLDHVRQTAMADVLYLNPIHDAVSNHKYDATDHGRISPEYGNMEDFRLLAEDVHRRGMRLVLDGVFNHMGRAAPKFQEALRDAASPWRQWFFIDEANPRKYRSWNNVANLPEIDVDEPEVQKRMFADDDAPLRTFLRAGADGWRLDTANDLGPRVLHLMAEHARREKPDAALIGEVWNYPEGWCPPLDGVINMHLRQILLELADGHLAGQRAGRLIERSVEDMGIEAALRSWIILDNHDTPRLATRVRDQAIQRLLRALQFTLPGAPCVYYGSEVGMEGGDDPEQRAPMRWDLVNDGNQELAAFRQLASIRRANPALRFGQFRLLDTQHLLAFLRYTHRVADSILVLANPSDRSVRETVPLRDPRLMSASTLVDLADTYRTQIFCGMVNVEIPARGIRMLRLPDLPAGLAYSAYKRIN